MTRKAADDNDTANTRELRNWQDPEVNPITSLVQMLFLRWKIVGESSHTPVALQIGAWGHSGQSPAGVYLAGDNVS